MTEPTHAEIAASIANGDAIVCLEQCWACKFGSCFDPPQWHTWADDDDIEHAKATGQSDPTKSRCGCSCAKEPATEETTPGRPPAGAREDPP